DDGDLVLDRFLDRDDVLLYRVDLVERRVERRALTGAGRAGHEDRAVGLNDSHLEALARYVADPERVEREEHRLLVEEAHDDTLAPRGRDGDEAGRHA